ncbi:conserved hypothetical protein [Cupriavidus necator]|uniref:Uncharacterized protein n=1 Tax=Cupriavidus necator TaxID=106590 RepID=A0A1K0IBY6_CUPNE|nr:conserved hypothetical protein [Cupriavidus necator]
MWTSHTPNGRVRVDEGEVVEVMQIEACPEGALSGGGDARRGLSLQLL